MTYSEYFNRVRSFYPNFALHFEGFESNGQSRIFLEATLGETRTDDPEIASRAFVVFTCSYEEWEANFCSEQGKISIVERLLQQLERNKQWQQKRRRKSLLKSTKKT